MESAKSRAWRARVLDVLTCFACLRANVLGVLTCLRAHVLGVLACSRAYVLGVLTCLACSRAWRAYVLGVLGVLTYLRAYVGVLACVSACLFVLFPLHFNT